ncbi:MAG: mercury resistance protein [Candidatus Rokubacteria bacterium]|nr:mercury resistance protein [Candidatus Rokubacteria bacterium]MBI2555205.1 mercury resistance protein [Candidatus Rokubacteria bacterium]
MTPPPRPRSVKGYLLLGLAFITCPCHLPLLLAVLAGTGLAGALSQYFGVAFVALSLIFLASLVLGLKAVKGSQQGRT